jgi:hypothetical protein
MTIAGMNPDPARQQRVEWVELAEVALAFATFADERAVRPTPCTDTLVRALRRHVVRPSKSALLCPSSCTRRVPAGETGG